MRREVQRLESGVRLVRCANVSAVTIQQRAWLVTLAGCAKLVRVSLELPAAAQPPRCLRLREVRGKVLLLRRPVWEFEPRTPFDHRWGDPWDEPSPRPILVRHQNPKSFALPLLHQATAVNSALADAKAG